MADENSPDTLHLATMRYVDERVSCPVIVGFPFALTEASLEAANRRKAIKGVVTAAGDSEPVSVDSRHGYYWSDPAKWVLPKAHAQKIVFAGPWWLLSMQMIDEARNAGIRAIVHRSSGRWWDTPLALLVGMKLARRFFWELRHVSHRIRQAAGWMGIAGAEKFVESVAQPSIPPPPEIFRDAIDGARKTGLLHAQGIVLSRGIRFARTIGLKRLKSLLTRVLGWQEPIQPPHMRNATFALEGATKCQEHWNDNLPLVSIIIPCYNYGRYVEEAIDSVLRQTFQRLEIIVVNDGSTDPGTVAVLRDLDKAKTRVLHQPNSGLPGARNRGIRQARGKYICCLDADDTIEPTYLEKAISLLEANPGVGFAYSWVRLFGDVQDVWYTEPFDLEALVRYNHVSVAAVYRRADWQQVGGYCSEMRHGYEDWEFWVRLAGQGLRGYLIPELLFNYRRHGRSMIDAAQEKHSELVSDIAGRNASLFSDQDLRAKLPSGYRDHHVDRPFLNLSRPEQFLSDASPDSLLVLLPWLVMGGAETVAYNVLRALRSSMDIHIFTSLPSENEWHDRFYDFTSSIYHLPNFLPEYYWEAFLQNFLTTRKIKNVLIFGSKFGYHSLPKIKKWCKVIRTINFLHSDSEFGYFSESVQYSTYFDDHIAVSQRIADKLHRVGGIDESKIHVIYSGVETENTFNPQLYDALQCKKHLKIPQNKEIVT